MVTFRLDTRKDVDSLHANLGLDGRSRGRPASSHPAIKRLFTVLDGVPSNATGSNLLSTHNETEVRAVTQVAALWVAYLTGVSWLATHCHFPLGIFTHVSVNREVSSIDLPEVSVPLPLKPPVAMAVLPKAVTFRSV